MNLVKKSLKKRREAEQIDHDSMSENGTSDEEENSTAGTVEMESSEADDSSDHEPSKPKITKRKSENGATINHSNKKTKLLSAKEKVKPPTLEEINELKETRNLFHSNLFRLQVKEMLTELKVKDKYKNYIKAWLEQLKSFLKTLETSSAKEDIDNMQWLCKGALKAPFALEQLRVQKQKSFQFQFVKPTSEPYLIGAAATDTLLGSTQLFADICLPMPSESFQKDNYLNLIYEQKRAFYLTYLASKMLIAKEYEELSEEHMAFNYYANDPLRPVLEITPPNSAGSLAKKLRLRIFVAAEEHSFKLNRFVPSNSNIRASLFDDDCDETEESVPTPTPHYNAGILFDLTMQRNQRLLNETFNSHQNFQEGLILLKVWLQQRQLNVGFSGFHGHIMAMYIAYLFKQRRLHVSMSSYQVARNVWNHLALSTWDEPIKGITLCATESQANQPTLEQFHAYYDVVFIDVSGFYNICSKLSSELYRRVRHEAKLAVDMLNDMQLNSFQLIFMTKCPLYTQFDHILKVNKKDVIEQILELHVQPADKYDYVGYAYPQLLKVITSLLRKGLGERVRTLLPIETPMESWSPQVKAIGCTEYLHLGIVLNPEHAYEVLDKGPEAIAENAQEFRSFWGEKAQLRRFQDGSITESIVWASATDSLMKKRLIVRSIVQHLFEQHFQVEPKDIEYIASEFDVVYKLTTAFKTDKMPEKYRIEQDSDAEQLSLRAIRAFDDLTRRLTALSELPLEIVSIAGISPIFRYCEATPVVPLARIINEHCYAMSVQRGVIQLGASNKWPNELAALRALKTAFYIQIAQLLREKHHLQTKVTYDGVLVLKQGYCFVLEIAHPKEVALLKREKTERGITQYVDCEASIALEKRHYILPKVTGALHALYQLYPSYGATVMIAKRWLYAQLIDDGLWPEECTELLIASQFLKRNAQQVVCSPQTGFVRFLHLLADTDWKAELFLLNFNNGLDDNDITDLEQRFNTTRESFPPLCIATAYDQKHCGTLWTSNDKPNAHVLARVTLLARQALSIIKTALLATDAPFIKPPKVFTSSTQGYDLVIQIKPENVPNTLAYDFGSPFTAYSKPNWRLPLADTNFLHDAVRKLREAYSDYAAFFYNACGGKEIAVVWKPANVFAEKDFKVNEVNGCELSANSVNKVQINKQALVEDFKFLLKDYYLRIDTVDAILSASRESANIAATTRYFSQKQELLEPTKVAKKVKLEKMKKATAIRNDIKAEPKLHKIKRKINTLKKITKKNLKLNSSRNEITKAVPMKKRKK